MSEFSFPIQFSEHLCWRRVLTFATWSKWIYFAFFGILFVLWTYWYPLTVVGFLVVDSLGRTDDDKIEKVSISRQCTVTHLLFYYLTVRHCTLTFLLFDCATSHSYFSIIWLCNVALLLFYYLTVQRCTLTFLLFDCAMSHGWFLIKILLFSKN